MGAEAAWGWSLLGTGVSSPACDNISQSEITVFQPSYCDKNYCGDRTKADLKKKQLELQYPRSLAIT